MTVKDAAANIVNLVGSLDGLQQSFPATNADGTPNTAAQAKAISDTVKALVETGMFQLPTGVSLAQVQSFAPGMLGVMDAYKSATKKTQL